MASNFIDEHYDMASVFFDVAYDLIDFYKELLGTDITIQRPKITSQGRRVLGGSFTSTFVDDAQTDTLHARVIINRSEMVHVWKRNVDTIDIYDNERILKEGDVFFYNDGEMKYSFKVKSVESYSPRTDIIFKFSVIGMMETIL